MELEKKSDHWEIVKPLRARGDDQKIGDLIAQVTTARIEQFVADDHGDLHAYGLAEPRGSITLFAVDDKTGQMLQIGGAARKRRTRFMCALPRADLFTRCRKKSRKSSIQNQTMCAIVISSGSRRTFSTGSRSTSASKGKVVLGRKDENWTIVSRNNAPANSGEAMRLIDTLQQAQVARFVEDVASNLAKYGLDKPQLQITFSSFASENTAESKAGESPIATIAFGKEDGDIVYARLGDEPFIVAAPKKFLDQILGRSFTMAGFGDLQVQAGTNPSP